MLLMNVERLCWDFEVLCIVTFVYMSNTCIFCLFLVRQLQSQNRSISCDYLDVDINNVILYVYLMAITFYLVPQNLLGTLL